MGFEYASTTTLNRIRAAHPCQKGWSKLLAHLGKTRADDEPLPILTILESNGLDDALWALDADPALERLARHVRAWCAEQVLHIFERERPNDTRVRDQIAMLRRDDATAEERNAAAWGARDAASDATRGSAAREAAKAAAWAAVCAAAWAAAWAAVCAAERDAARGAQERQLREMLVMPARRAE